MPHKASTGPPVNKDKSINKESQNPISRDSPIKEVQASPEKRETPLKRRDSPMRDLSKASPPTIASGAAPELDAILSDLDNQDWRTRYVPFVLCSCIYLIYAK